jgi:Transposase, Mutator family
LATDLDEGAPRWRGYLATEPRREKLKALMGGRSEIEDGRSELVRLAARLIIEEALEGGAGDALGREYYGRGAVPGAGYRNGYRTGRVKSAEGAIEYSTPQIADRREPFRSRIREVVRGRTEELEALAGEMSTRGLSTRDIEAVFADGDDRSLLSRTAGKARSPSGCGRNTRRLPAGICRNSRSPTVCRRDCRAAAFGPTARGSARRLGDPRRW